MCKLKGDNMEKMTFQFYKMVLETIYNMVSKNDLVGFSNWVINTVELNKNHKMQFKDAFNSQIEFINLREKIKSQLDGSNRRAVLGLLNVIGWNWNSVDSQKAYNSLLSVKRFDKMYINYISKNDLNKKYSFLSYSNGMKKGDNKIYFISRDLIILKSLDREDLYLKAFCSYKGATKRLLKNNKPLNYNKFKGLSEKYYINSSIDWPNIQSMDEKERIYFYSFLKKPEVGLNKSERTLLKKIRSCSGGENFPTYLEGLESKVNLLKEVYEKENTYESYNAFIGAQKELWALTEEHNSDKKITTIEDYL